jgi:hypothetical protein
MKKLIILLAMFGIIAVSVFAERFQEIFPHENEESQHIFASYEKVPGNQIELFDRIMDIARTREEVVSLPEGLSFQKGENRVWVWNEGKEVECYIRPELHYGNDQIWKITEVKPIVVDQ